ncbi:MAG: Hpt domain-containing protein [Akkermansiaceae bacterium]|nr:Hpt domain-containing protein [Akkermansiaceae bacterium]
MAEAADPIIDLAKLEDVSGNDPVFIASIVRSIIETLPGQLTAIRAACEARDWTEVARTSHQTISTTTYVGSAEMQALLRSIEREAGEASPEARLPPLMERLKSLGDDVMRALRDALASHERS